MSALLMVHALFFTYYLMRYYSIWCGNNNSENSQPFSFQLSFVITTATNQISNFIIKHSNVLVI